MRASESHIPGGMGLLAVVIAACLLLGCGKAETPAEALEVFTAEGSGYVKEQEVNGLKFTVQYRPALYMALWELREQPELKRQALDSLLADFGDAEYFMLEVSRSDGAGEGQLYAAGAKDYNEYAQRMALLSFGMTERVAMLRNGEEVAPILYHAEHGYELGQKQRFLFSFPGQAGQGNLTFQYHDDVFQTGRHKFNFNKNELRLPALPG